MASALLPKLASQTAPPATPTFALSPEDDAFLEQLQTANFQFFWEQADPETGLVKDRCHVREADNGIVGSIASTGFGLTALCIGHQRGYVSPPTRATGAHHPSLSVASDAESSRLLLHFAISKPAKAFGILKSLQLTLPCWSVAYSLAVSISAIPK